MSERLSGPSLAARPDVEEALENVRALVRYTKISSGPKTTVEKQSIRDFALAASELFLAVDHGVVERQELAGMASTTRRRSIDESARIAQLWERACSDAGVPSPFGDPDMPIERFNSEDFKRLDVCLMLSHTAQTALFLDQHRWPKGSVVPTARHDLAVINDWLRPDEVPPNDLGYTWRKEAMVASVLDFESVYHQMLANVAKDSVEWIASIANQAGMTMSEANVWLTPRVLRGYAKSPPASYEKRLVRYLGRARSITAESVAASLGLPLGDVDQVLTKSVRRSCAISGGEARACRYVQSVLVDLSSERLAQELGLPEWMVNKAYPLSMRKVVALGSKAPLEQMRRIHGKTAELIGRGLPKSVAQFMAQQYRHDEVDGRCDALLGSLGAKPARVAIGVWLEAVSRHPKDSGARDKRIAKFYLWRNLARAISLDSAPEGKRSYHELFGDSSTDPAEILFGDNEQAPEDELAELAKSAGVSPKQLEMLLIAFQEGVPEQLDEQQANVLQRLTQAGQLL